MNESNEPARGEAREFWEAAVRLWEESGLSVRDFCRREGLGESSLHAWRRRFRSEGTTPESDAKPSAMPKKVPLPQGRRRALQRPSVSKSRKPADVEFLPVHVVGDKVSRGCAASAETAAGTSLIEIVGPSPWRVRIQAGFDPTALDAVLTALEGRPC